MTTTCSYLGIYISFKRSRINPTVSAANQSSGKKICFRIGPCPLDVLTQDEQIQLSLLRKTRQLPQSCFTHPWPALQGRNPRGMTMISLRLSINGVGLNMPCGRVIASFNSVMGICKNWEQLMDSLARRVVTSNSIDVSGEAKTLLTWHSADKGWSVVLDDSVLTKSSSCRPKARSAMELSSEMLDIVM